MAKDGEQAEGNLRFQVKLFVLLRDLASHWVSKCVASFIVAVEEKRGERAAIRHGGQSHKPKAGRLEGSVCPAGSLGRGAMPGLEYRGCRWAGSEREGET